MLYRTLLNSCLALGTIASSAKKSEPKNYIQKEQNHRTVEKKEAKQLSVYHGFEFDGRKDFQ